jgi:hypothetical protein
MDGEPFAASTANRTRIVARACVSGAVDAGLIAVHPWPPRSRSRARRKVARRKTLDLRRLPDPETMARAIDAIVNDQPGSRVYRVMTAVAYYAGLRPSEVAMLRVKSVELPTDGWGRVHVTEADVWHDQPGEPKTGPRMVPIPPVLVGILRTWIVEQALTGDDQMLFRTTTGTKSNGSSMVRATVDTSLVDAETSLSAARCSRPIGRREFGVDRPKRHGDATLSSDVESRVTSPLGNPVRPTRTCGASQLNKRAPSERNTPVRARAEFDEVHLDIACERNHRDDRTETWLAVDMRCDALPREIFVDDRLVGNEAALLADAFGESGEKFREWAEVVVGANASALVVVTPPVVLHPSAESGAPVMAIDRLQQEAFRVFIDEIGRDSDAAGGAIECVRRPAEVQLLC